MAPRRTRTITPIQALSLSNNAFMEKCAEQFAARVRREAGDDARRQVERAWRLAFARPPNDRERRARPVVRRAAGPRPALPRAVQRERVPVRQLTAIPRPRSSP